MGLWYVRIKHDPGCFAIFKVLCVCVSLGQFRENLGCQAKEAELPSVSGGMPWVGFELGKGRKSWAWNWKRPLRSSIQSVDSVNICKSWMSFYAEPNFSSWADSSGLHRVPIWGFSKEVNFWLAMSASDAGNSSGGKLYICHSGSSPEALKEMALPSRDLCCCYRSNWAGTASTYRAENWECSGQPRTMKNCSTWLSNVLLVIPGFPGGTSGKEPTYPCRRPERHGFDPWVRKVSWRRAWQLTPVFLPEESHGQGSLADYSPWGCKESDTTEVTEHARMH